MDVNDTKLTKPVQIQRVGSGKAIPGKQKPSSELTKAPSVQHTSAPVEIKLSEVRPDKKSDQIRNRANSLIGIVNQAKESAADIEQFANSIDGIAVQASDESLSDSRRAVLEQEAQELVKEIENRSNSISSNKIATGSESEIRLEIEEEIGKALDTIFPDVAKDAFGIGEVSFSQKETIVNVRTNIALAKERIDQLRNVVDKATGDLSVAVEELDIASQNEEASRASVRELDKALELVGRATGEMVSDPSAALDSIKIPQNALDLLKE